MHTRMYIADCNKYWKLEVLGMKRRIKRLSKSLYAHFHMAQRLLLVGVRPIGRTQAQASLEL